MPQYYTEYGKKIYNPDAYAKTGAPMYKYNSNVNINQKTQIYKLNLEDGKKYVGKTTNIDKRMDQHMIKSISSDKLIVSNASKISLP